MAVELTTIPPQDGELARLLVVAGDGGAVPPNRNWLRSSASIGSVTGDTEISAGLGSIDRILWHQSIQLRIFRNGSDSLSVAIAAGGELAGKSILLAFSDTDPALRFDVDGASVTAVPSYLRLAADAAAEAVFNGVAVGDPINVVIADAPGADPVFDAVGDLEAGAPGITAEAEAVPVATPFHDVAADITAGVPGVEAEAVAVAGAPQVHDAEADLVAGVPVITAEAEAVPAAVPHDVAGDLEAGAPDIEAVAVVVGPGRTTSIQTIQFLSSMWVPRSNPARVEMPIQINVEGDPDDLCPALCRELSRRIDFLELGENCVASDGGPHGTLSENSAQRVVGGLVVAVSPNQSQPEYASGFVGVNECRLVLSQGVSKDSDDLDLLIDRRREIRRVLAVLSGDIGS